MTEPWKAFQDTATFILNDMAHKFGLDHVESAQVVLGRRSGTSYQIDAKGVCLKEEAFIVVECRPYTTSRLKQEHLAALAYRIHDVGAAGGIIISPLGLQEGAERIAKAEGVVSMRLTENSTPFDWILCFLDRIFAACRDLLRVGDSARAILRNEATGNTQTFEST